MEKGKSLQKMYLWCLWVLHRRKIQHGRKDPRVQRNAPALFPPSVTVVKFSLCSVEFLFFLLGKSTLTLVTFAKYDWFKEWKDDKVTNRGPDYKELKQTFIDSVLEVVMDVFPKITRDKVGGNTVSVNLSEPVKWWPEH